MDLRYSIVITDCFTGETLVSRCCDRFSFTARRRRNKDLPSHEIVVDEFDTDDSSLQEDI